MKTFLKPAAISICSLIICCAPSSGFAQQKKTPRLQTMVDTERAFSRMSEEKGIREAFAAFIADDGILFRPRAVKGKEWMLQHPLPASKSRPLLTWQPIFAAISRAGDLGYTTGPWQYKNDIKDAKASAFGDFMTVWKKQADGSFKFVLDLGVSHAAQQSRIPLFGPVSRAPSRRVRANIGTARAEIIKAENDFSNASAERGAVEAFLARAGSEVRLFREGHEPFVGKKAAASALTPLNVQWTWEPAFADVSASGDLGYSYGAYQLRDKTAGKVIEEGNYARIWRRVRGAWKVVIDVANPVPPETKTN